MRGTGRRRCRLLVLGAPVAVLLAIAIVAGSVAIAHRDAPPPLAAPISRFVPVPASPGSAARIRIDTDLYLPSIRPAPAVLLAHGFGQTKADLAPEAGRLQREGYVVLAYSARGFGRSGGRIGLDSLDGEVPDARALVDLLGASPDVLQRSASNADGRRDPVIGVVGASYGGALALMLGASDPRIDTVVAGITWGDLGQALDPLSAGRSRDAAPKRTFKAAWAAQLFGAGAPGDPDPCGRFTAQLCDLYRRLVSGGTPTPADAALLARSSPDSVLAGMRAPTLLLQGLQDSLFGLDQSDDVARRLRAAHVPVRVRWFDGGHDGGGTAGTEDAVDDWLAAELQQGRFFPERRFEYAVPASASSFAEQHATERYPGLYGRMPPVRLGVEGDEQTIVNPPGGQPVSVTALPGVAADSALGRGASGLLAARNPKGQAARFTSTPFDAPALLAGTAHVLLRVDPADGRARDAELFVQATALTGAGSRALPGGVAPVHVRLPAQGAVVDVALPPTVWRFGPGDRLAVTVRTTDSQYVGSTTPAAYRVAAASQVVLPIITAVPAAPRTEAPTRTQVGRIGSLLVALALLLAAVVLVGRVRRRAARRAEARGGRPGGPSVPPLVVRGLTKRFRSGFLAVDDVSFTVERGQVVGLLGENGAGKTTTMRMVLGLSRPSSGAALAFGVPLAPGSPVLRRIGAFVEGPGFLPHLSGLRNLRLHWAATGRPMREAHLEEVLAVADLGRAVHRRVRGYSQGMRQRLAIAQAMLGMPDLLVLDEPTNGLDPPQIAALRGVLQRYAAGGRAVVVSSHLLAEVERTCTSVVVMTHGRVVAAGPVTSIAGGGDELVIGVHDATAAVEALAAAGVEALPLGTGEVRVLLRTATTGEVIRVLDRAGIEVAAVRRGRRLEEAFLDLIGSGSDA